jgi:hypothetical protein
MSSAVAKQSQLNTTQFSQRRLGDILVEQGVKLLFNWTKPTTTEIDG